MTDEKKLLSMSFEKLLVVYFDFRVSSGPYKSF